MSFLDLDLFTQKGQKMSNFYVEKDNKIVLFDNNFERLQNTLILVPELQGLEIQETERPIIDFQFADTEEFNVKWVQKEKERIGNLTMTKRVFALLLKEYGITYVQLKELIATNDDAQLEWDLCSELRRNNPLLDVMSAKLGITPEQLDEMFKYANGEIGNINGMGQASDTSSNRPI